MEYPSLDSKLLDELARVFAEVAVERCPEEMRDPGGNPGARGEEWNDDAKSTPPSGTRQAAS